MKPPLASGVRRFEINLVVRVYFLLDIKVEAVGVITFIRDAIHHAKLGGIQTAEAVTQVFTRRAVEAKAVARLFFPLIHRLTQTFHNRHAFARSASLSNICSLPNNALMVSWMPI
jgi:hypothetical protein